MPLILWLLLLSFNPLTCWTKIDLGSNINSCIPDEKIQVNPRFWLGSEILF